jgi:hypothetical protein
MSKPAQFLLQDFFKLFLIVIFPQHTWTLYMAFRDVGWVAARSDYSDALGLLSYALLFALAEGIILFLAILVIKVALPKKWESEKQLAMMGSMVFILSLWAIVPQVYALSGYQIPKFFAQLMIISGHPLWVLYGSALGASLVSIVIPAVLILRKPGAAGKIFAILDRLTALSVFYLVLDTFALFNVILRNVR